MNGKADLQPSRAKHSFAPGAAQPHGSGQAHSVASEQGPGHAPDHGEVQPRLLFTRGDRLLRHADFERVYNSGRRHFASHLTAFYLLHKSATTSPDPTASQFSGAGTAHVGITVGRPLGGAVVRNRIKRKTRDAVRHQLPGLKLALATRAVIAEVVFNPKKSAQNAPADMLRAEVERAFQVIAAAPVGPAPEGARRHNNSRGSRGRS